MPGLMATYFGVFAAYTAYVFCRAFQQLNVQHHRILWITPVSVAMGQLDVFVMGAVAIVAVNVGYGWPLAGLGLAMGLGGAVGAILAMVLHKRFR